MTWEEFTPVEMMFLVCQIAQQSREGSGAMAAEETCVMLYAIASWLREEGLIPRSAALPRPRCPGRAGR